MSETNSTKSAPKVKLSIGAVMCVNTPDYGKCEATIIDICPSVGLFLQVPSDYPVVINGEICFGTRVWYRTDVERIGDKYDGYFVSSLTQKGTQALKDGAE